MARRWPVEASQSAPASEADIHGISADPAGWDNYRPAEEDPATCTALFDHMVQSGWAARCHPAGISSGR